MGITGNEPRWRRRSDERPGEIADAALEIFAERGFSATKMEEIAKRAGVTKGTVYLYFPSKEELFREVVRESIVPGLEMGERLVAEHAGTARELMAELLRRWWAGLQDCHLQAIPKLMLAEAGNFPELARFYVEEVVLRARRLFASVIERGVASGEFRDVDATLAAQLAMAALLNLAAYRRSLLPFEERSWDLDRYLELHIDILLRGLARAEGASDDE